MAPTVYRWEYDQLAEAAEHYARLLAAGYRARLYLSYAGGGWVVTSR
jgi:hypothetical protein